MPRVSFQILHLKVRFSVRIVTGKDQSVLLAFLIERMNVKRDSPKFSQEVLSRDFYMGVRAERKEIHAKSFPNLTSFCPKKIPKKGKAKYTHSNLCSCVFQQYTTEQIIFH